MSEICRSFEEEINYIESLIEHTASEIKQKQKEYDDLVLEKQRLFNAKLALRDAVQAYIARSYFEDEQTHFYVPYILNHIKNKRGFTTTTIEDIEEICNEINANWDYIGIEC